ncbi:MAG: hypothetical protein ACE5F7_01580 [Nitrospiria bacterium]
MINLVAALMHEARPLIERYRMSSLKGGHPYPIFGNRQFTVIVSGIGKLASAAAVGYLHALTFKDGPSGWLNFGLAGHSDFDLGQGFTAHHVIDRGSGRSHYPLGLSAFPCPSSVLMTVDQPERSYHAHGGYDMEASGFFRAALRASTIELIHCYKVVSDNPRHPVKKMTKAAVTGFIGSRIEEMDTILSILLESVAVHRKAHAPDCDLEDILKRWHFTETQSKQLTRLLQRRRALYAKSALPQLHLTDYPYAKDFLSALKQRLDAHRLKI